MTPKERAAMQQALGALEACVEKFYATKSIGVIGALPMQAVKAAQAITAIRAAIAQEHWTEYEHAIAAAERKKFMAVCEAEYNKYDALITEEDVGHEEATAIIHLMRKLEGMK